jgi:hypothetical protein
MYQLDGTVEGMQCLCVVASLCVTWLDDDSGKSRRGVPSHSIVFQLNWTCLAKTCHVDPRRS